MKLFVRNFPYDLDDAQLKEIFEAAGEVVEAKVITDRYTGKSRGFGFVTMGSPEAGEKAIAEIGGTQIGGREIVVDKARDSQRR